MARTYAFYKGTKAENPDSPLFDVLVTSWPRTKGRFAHVERVTLLAGKTHGMSSSFRDGGVRIKQIDFDTGNWEFVTIPGTFNLGIDRFTAKLGKPYDVPGLFGFLLPVWLQVRWAWFCSEICADMEGLEDTYKWHPNRFYAYLTGLPGAKIRTTLVR